MNARQFTRPFAVVLLGLSISFLSVDGLAAVGRTEATFGVTQNGAATYTIPIQATEGVNGLTPTLAISYVGPGSRSIVGVGYAISGLSYITPCRKTITQDLNAAPVTLTSSDRYCLDGARLRQIGTGTYGGTNSQYRTELDQLVRVTSLASTGNIPGWFQVEMPDGLIYEYGNSADSKLMSKATGGTPQFWAISKITDTSNNAIVFHYDTDAVQRRFRPSYIEYKTRDAAQHSYKISFVYQSTPLPYEMRSFTPSLQGGAAHEEDRLLERIELSYDNVVYRSYLLTYQAGAGDNQRLWKVQECAASTLDCLPATVFTWQSATAGHGALTSTGKAVASGVLPLDINGDGIEDLAWAASGTWRYVLGGASGFGPIVNTAVAAVNTTKSMVLEWNGDGFDDLLIDWSDGKWRVLKGGASGFITTVVHAGPGGIPSNAAGLSWTVSDVNADDRDDLLSMPLNALLTIHVRHNGTNGFGASTQMYSSSLLKVKSKGFIQATGASAHRRPDFNGDSRFDLLVYACVWEPEPPSPCVTSDRWFQLMSNGDSFTFEDEVPGATYNIDVRFGDFNADGLTDIVYPQASNWAIGFGQGSGGFDFVPGPTTAGHATYQTLVGDYDGDGLDDFYVTKNSPFQWQVYRSTGVDFEDTPISTTISGSGLGWMLVDQSGDSLPDIGRYDSASSIWSFGTHQGVPGEHLLTATDGLANKVTFAYLPMTSATVYAKGVGATYPVSDFEGSAPLVRTLTVSPAGGAAYAFTHKYANAHMHAQGRAFLGMGRREITDGRNGVYTVEFYHSVFPFVGTPTVVNVYQKFEPQPTPMKLIRSTAHHYNQHVLSPVAGNERYLPYRWKTITDLYEVGGVRDGDPLTQVRETHTVNTWGNSTFVELEVEDVDGLSPEVGSVYVAEITSTFIQDSTNWCIGLPLTRSELRSLPDSNFETRTMAWQVDGTKCRVDQETLEPGGGTLASLITDFAYDVCGNVNTITRKAAGTAGADRVTQINYGSRCQRPAIVTNPEGNVTTLIFSWPLAVLGTHRDPNGLDTDFEYDGFGRLTRELRPDGAGVRFALAACAAGSTCWGKTSAARVRVTRTERSTTDGVLRTDEQFLDGIGRLRWEHTASLESGPAIVETLYDNLNRTIERTQPYFAGGTVYSTQFAYDLIGRVTSIDAPISESAPSGRITGFTHEGRNLEVTDPKGMTITRRSNALGQLRAIVDPSPGGTTSYAYHPFAELKSITDAAGNVTSWSHNSRGFVDGTSDSDSGNWTYQVNAFGETTHIWDAKVATPNASNWTTRLTYDELSRITKREEAEGTTNFTWGVAGDNSSTEKYIGQLKSVTMPNYSENYFYDSLSRLKQLQTVIEGSPWTFDQTYSAATGLPEVRTYPVSGGGFRLSVIHNYQNNLLQSVAQYQGATTYWQAASTDAWGHVQDEAFGNGVTAFTDFDQASGFMDTREAWNGATQLINANVDWDLNGNLTKRQDLLQNPGVTEDIVYDNLNCFSSSDLSGGTSGDTSVVLNAIGNITSKDGQAYLYTGAQSGCTYYAHAQPRAVRKIGSTVYCYDSNGNMNKRGGSTISYTSYNLPSVIGSGSNSSSLFYGAFRNRYKQIAVSSAGTETTIYVAGLFERVTRPNGTIEYRHQIPGGNGSAAIHTRINGIGTTYYLHADQLGSPELITNSSGGELVRLSFAPYGARRDRDWNGPVSAADLAKIADTTRAGFTGHEHLDSVGLIHMNGRVYEPGAGRFLGADPIVGVGLSQAANRYAYVWNNPLTWVDPSGFQVRGIPGQNDGPPSGGVAGPGGAVIPEGNQECRRNPIKLCTDRHANRGLSRGQVEPEWRGRNQVVDPVQHGVEVGSAVDGARKGPQFEDWQILLPFTMLITLEDYYTEKLPESVQTPVLIASMIFGTGKLTAAARGSAAAVRAGQAGEAAVRAAVSIGPATRITVNGVTRIPDGLTTRALSEVKNVGSLSYTRQLRDFAAFAQQSGRQFDLYVRPNTKLSGPLLDAINAGQITLRYIPSL